MTHFKAHGPFEAALVSRAIMNAVAAEHLLDNLGLREALFAAKRQEQLHYTVLSNAVQ